MSSQPVKCENMHIMKHFPLINPYVVTIRAATFLTVSEVKDQSAKPLEKNPASNLSFLQEWEVIDSQGVPCDGISDILSRDLRRSATSCSSSAPESSCLERTQDGDKHNGDNYVAALQGFRQTQLVQVYILLHPALSGGPLCSLASAILERKTQIKL